MGLKLDRIYDYDSVQLPYQIFQVDMDTEDGGSDGGLSGFEERIFDKTMVPPGRDSAADGMLRLNTIVRMHIQAWRES